MKRILVFLSLFFYMFFIVSCKEETKLTINSANFESFYDVSFTETFEEDTFKIVAKFEPKYDFQVDEGEFELSIFLRTYDLDTIYVIEKNKTISIVDLPSVIFRESIEEDIMLIEMFDYAIKNANIAIKTSENISINERVYQTPELTSYPLWFSIEDPINNHALYQEINQKMDAFKNNQNQFDFETIASIILDDGNEVIDLSFEQQMLLQVSPLYLDMNFEGIHQIITEMNESIVMIYLPMEPDSNGYYHYLPIDLGENIENMNPVDDLDFDATVMRFTKLNNRLYHFITRPSDYFTEEDLLEIEALYGDEANQIIQSIYMQGQIEFATNYIRITYGLVLGDENYQMKMMISMKMTHTTFDPIDFSDSSVYKMQAPTSIDLASFKSPINQEIEGKMDGNGLYYKFELEQGSYVIESESNQFGGMQFKLYNDSYEEIYLGIVDSNTTMRSLGVDHEYVLIQEPGTYYIRASYAFYNQLFSFKLSKLDIDLMDNDHGIFITNGIDLSFELQNGYDIYTLVFDINQITGVKISGNDIPYIFAKPFLHQNYTRFISDTNSIYFILTPEQPILTLINPNLNTNKSYQLSIDLIQQTHPSTKDESKMEAISNLYNTSEIITGPSIPRVYMKLIIADEARYQFHFDMKYGVIEGEILNSDYTKISNIYNNTSIDLVPGIYYVYFSGNYVGIGQIKYTKINLNIQTILHELASIPTPEPFNQTLPRVYGTLNSSLNRIYYQFTLEETSFVMVDKEHSLFNSQNEKISFDKVPYGTAFTYQLEPGTYKVRINAVYYNYPQDYSLILAKIENPYTDDNHFAKDIVRAYLNVSYAFTADYNGDRDVMKFVVTQRAEYRFYTNMQLVLCDSNRVNIDTIYAVWSGHTITLDPGTYYLINYPSLNHEWTLTITA